MCKNRIDSSLEEFGIDTTYVDEDNITRMRDAQSIILDITKMLREGDVNANKMLLAIAGGRYQYSKISAILKDETEILRMWAEAVNSEGFAEEQLGVQLDTINAKVKQLEANVQDLYQTIMEGSIGNLVKSGVELISSSVATLNKHFNAVLTGAETLVTIWLGGKLVRVLGSLLNGYQRIAAFQKELQAAGYAGGLFGVFKEGLSKIPAELKSRYTRQEIVETEALTASTRRLSAEEGREASAKGAVVSRSMSAIAAKVREAGATTALTGATRANTTAIVQNTISKTENAAASTASAAASTAAAEASLAAGAAMRVASVGAGLFTGALLINWLYFCGVMLVVCCLIVIIVSLLTKAPDEQKIQGLVFGTSTPEQRAATRASWNKWDIIHSFIILGITVAFYIYFW